MADFSTLQGRVFRRGFEHLNDASNGLADVKAYMNARYLQACERAEFPFLYADSTPAAAPLTISDLGRILSVTDTTTDRTLKHQDRRQLLDWYGDLTTVGTCSYWYRDSETSIKVYPADTTTTLAVRYCKKPAELSANGDTPVIPSQWQQIIVEGTVADLYRDLNDEQSAAIAEQRYETLIGQMVSAYAFDSLDAPEFIQVVGASEDW